MSDINSILFYADAGFSVYNKKNKSNSYSKIYDVIFSVKVTSKYESFEPKVDFLNST